MEVPLSFCGLVMVQIFILKTSNFALNVECVDLANEYQWGELLNYTYFSCTKATCVCESVQSYFSRATHAEIYARVYTLLREALRGSGASLPAQIWSWWRTARKCFLFLCLVTPATVTRGGQGGSSRLQIAEGERQREGKGQGKGHRLRSGEEEPEEEDERGEEGGGAPGVRGEEGDPDLGEAGEGQGPVLIEQRGEARQKASAEAEEGPTLGIRVVGLP